MGNTIGEVGGIVTYSKMYLLFPGYDELLLPQNTN